MPKNGQKPRFFHGNPDRQKPPRRQKHRRPKNCVVDTFVLFGARGGGRKRERWTRGIPGTILRGRGEGKSLEEAESVWEVIDFAGFLQASRRRRGAGTEGTEESSQQRERSGAKVAEYGVQEEMGAIVVVGKELNSTMDGCARMHAVLCTRSWTAHGRPSHDGRRAVHSRGSARAYTPALERNNSCRSARIFYLFTVFFKKYIKLSLFSNYLSNNSCIHGQWPSSLFSIGYILTHDGYELMVSLTNSWTS